MVEQGTEAQTQMDESRRYTQRQNANLARLNGLDDKCLYDEINTHKASFSQLLVNLIRSVEDLQKQVDDIKKEQT